MTSRKSRRNRGADDSAEPTEALGTSLAKAADTAITSDSATTIVEWPSEKKRPTATGRLPSCISFRVDVVDRGDVVGVHRVTEPEAVGEECGRQQDRVGLGGDQHEAPRPDVEDEQESVEPDQTAPELIRRAE